MTDQRTRKTIARLSAQHAKKKADVLTPEEEERATDRGLAEGIRLGAAAAKKKSTAG